MPAKRRLVTLGTKRCSSRARVLSAARAANVHHAILSMLPAIRRLDTLGSKVRPLCAEFMPAALAVNVDHAVLIVFLAVRRLVAALYVESRRYPGEVM